MSAAGLPSPLPERRTLADGMRFRRHLLLRRICQATVLLAFVGTVRWGWNVAGVPLLRGDLSASTLLGVVPLADPFAVLQILFTRHALELQVLLGAGVILVFYALVGGRSFCAWVCPVNPVTDLSTWMRKRLGWSTALRLPQRLRYSVLILSLALSAIAGVAAFEWVSPIGILQRGLVYGMGAGWMVVVIVFLLDLTVSKHAWCGRLCPLGAFYALLGPIAQVRVKFDPDTCTHCGNCAAVCPEPQVLDLKQAAVRRQVVSGECTNCGGCIPVCPENSLKFGVRGARRR